MINEKRLLDFFEKILKINSPSKNEGEIVKYLRDYLTNLGFETWEDNTGELTGGTGNNLYGKLKGNPNLKSICFNSHIDTVLPNENLQIIKENGIIKSDSTTILGADDKAGVAASIEAINSIIDNNIDHGDIYVLFTVQEEIGTFGAQNAQIDKINADYAFSFDTGKPVLSLVVSAPSHWKMNYKIHGKSAHAAYAKGSINSISVAAKAIARFEVGQIDENSCCNVGIIKGGERFNVVPDYCEVVAEARSSDKDKALKLQEKITKAFEEECEKAGAKLEKEIHCEYDAFAISTDEPEFKLAYKTAKEFVKEPVIEHSLGGFDASIFNAKGMKTIVCGTGYENIHTNTEYISIEDLKTCAEFAYKLILNA